MTTTTTNFKSIQLLRQWCMLTLPTVFNDALSYNEQVCKLTEAINEMAITINGLPDYIIELVKELLDQMNLEEIVKQVLADYFFINVKNPPAPLVGAKGDGIANDTAAIQAMIDYAAGKKTYLFFPGGIYSVNQLVMKTGVSLIGEDRYRTIINLEAASNVDLIGGNMRDCTIGNLTLSANMPGQTQNCSIYNGNVGDMLWYNVILKNAYDVMSMNIGSLVQMDNIIVDGTQGNGLMIDGERCTITNLDFVNTSELNNNTLLTLNSNYAVIDKITCFTAIKNGINVAGNYCWVDGVIQNAITPVTNTGVGNVINISTANNNIVIKPQTSESYSGGLTVNAPSSTEIIAGNKTVNASGVTITANGTMELDGHNNVDITAGANLTENVTGNVNVNATNITETTTGNINLNSKELFLKPTNPLTYSKPVEVDKYFNGVPAKDVDGNSYTLLTAKGNTLESDIETVRTMEYFGYFFTPYCPVEEYYPQGTCLIDDNTLVCFYADNKNGTNEAVLQKIDMRNGSVLLSKKVKNAYHGNALTYVPESNEIYTVRYYDTGTTGYSNQIIIFNADTLTISRTLTLTSVESIAYMNYQQGSLYFSDRAQFPTFYKCNVDGTGITKLFTSTFSTMWISYVDRNLNLWYTNGYNTLVCSDLAGNTLGSYHLGFYSADFSTYHVEMESMMETSDGTLLFTDVAYKRTVNGIFRRHTISSFGKSIVKGQPLNWEYRFGEVMHSLAVTNQYNTFQNGYRTNNGYDSIEYAARMASAIPASLITLDGNKEVFDQWLVIRSDRVIFLNQMTIQGLVVDYSTVSSGLTLTIQSGAADKVADYAKLSYPTCLALWRFSRFISANCTIDGQNLAGVVGFNQGYFSECRITVGKITNCSVPAKAQWSNPSSFGGYTTDMTSDAISANYNVEQYGSNMFEQFGNAYGRKTITLTGVNFGNWTPQTFKGRRFRGQMMSMVINNNSYVFDLNTGGKCFFHALDGTNSVDVQFTATITNGSGDIGAKINITNIETVPANFNKTKLAITKIALW